MRWKQRRVMKKIAMFALAVLVLAGGGAVASAATAQPCTSGACYTEPAVLSNAGAWAANIKPASEYFGQGGAPFMTGLHWSKYSHSKAIAKGRLHAIKAGCTPTYKCKYYVVNVKWILTSPKWCSNTACGGGWYYSKGHLEWSPKRKLGAQHYMRVTKRGYWQ
jgi:hypothetical protein